MRLMSSLLRVGDISISVDEVRRVATKMSDVVPELSQLRDFSVADQPDLSLAVAEFVMVGGFDVMHNDLADAGASNFARDLRSLEYVNSGAHVSVVAHSYGTTTASLALAEDDVHVDAFVTLGSAGLPANLDSASDLRADAVFSGQAQDVWAIDQARGDQWAWTGRLSPEHPINPIDPEFGSHSFSVAGDGTLRAVTDHGAVTSDEGGYLDKQTESLRNVALATTGHGNLVSPYMPPAPTPLQKALIEGMTNGVAD